VRWLGDDRYEEDKAVCGFMSIPDGCDYELNETGWADEINEDYNRRGRKVKR
jgi:hypothetical protein